MIPPSLPATDGTPSDHKSAACPLTERGLQKRQTVELVVVDAVPVGKQSDTSRWCNGSHPSTRQPGKTGHYTHGSCPLLTRL